MKPRSARRFLSWRGKAGLRIWRVLAVAILVALAPGRVVAGEKKEDRTKANAEKIAAFVYPGSKSFQSNSVDGIAQIILSTPDEFEKVNEWYQEALDIIKSITAGVTDMPWPKGVLPFDIKGQRQSAVFRDDIRPKGDNVKEITVRAPTTRSYVSRTPERTVVVVINRGAEDKNTMVSVVLLPPERAGK